MDVIKVEPIDVEKFQAENPQSRFRILDTAVLKPGICALCGSAGGDGRQFVDFGKTMDWYGCVYFCTYCIGEAAKLLGLGNISEAFRKYEEMLLKYGNEKLESEYLRGRLNAAMVLVRNCTCADSGIGIPAVELPEAELIEPEPSGVGDESAFGDEPNADELDPIQGSDDVSAASSDDEPESKPARRTRKSS